MVPDVSAAEAKFVQTELEIGLVFAHIAASAKYPDKLDRNRANARKAYDTAQGYMQKLTFTPETSSQLHKLLERLRNQLADLGDSV